MAEHHSEPRDMCIEAIWPGDLLGVATEDDATWETVLSVVECEDDACDDPDCAGVVVHTAGERHVNVLDRPTVRVRTGPAMVPAATPGGWFEPPSSVGPVAGVATETRAALAAALTRREAPC